MSRFLQHRYTLRQHMIAIIGVCLCIYFVYHAIHGQRSLMRLSSLDSQIETMSQKHDTLKTKRIALEKKVKMLRPGSLDLDLLEEKVRLTLGYKHPDEHVILRPHL